MSTGHSKISVDEAASLAELPLAGIDREYPNAPQLVLNGPEDLVAPRQLHPAFYGCFDWHSAVHSHWTMIWLLKRLKLPREADIRAKLRANLTAKNLQAEADYFRGPNRQSFERMYGWAWLLKLALELRGWDDPDGAEWAKNLKPLEELIVERYIEFLSKDGTYPIRGGTHANSAFGMTFAFDFASATEHKELLEVVKTCAAHYFLGLFDCNYPVWLEPQGADFLSPALVEADLMARVLGEQFPSWFHRFWPEAANGKIGPVHAPPKVSDRSDPQIGHLDGLTLSRAWCLHGIAHALPEDDPARPHLLKAAQEHAEEGLRHVATGDYMGEHWLASFAVYMISVLASGIAT